MSSPTSTIILYKDSKIIPSRNMVVDSLSDYLNTLTKITISDFQYQRHHLEMEIKIDRSEVWQEFEISSNYDYLSIQNSDSSRVVYYFILEKRQIANSTIGLKLLMDTANTFKWNEDFIPNNKTRVLREHKDRFNSKLLSISFTSNSDFTRLITLRNGDTYTGKLVLKIDGTTEEINSTFKYVFILPARYSFIFFFNDIADQIRFYSLRDSSSIQLINFYSTDHPDGIVEGIDLYFNTDSKSNLVNHKRLVDFYSEGFDCPLYKTELGQLTHKEDMSWNLIYHNDNAEAINCHCIPANDGLQAYVLTSKTLTYTDFEDGAYYDIAPFNVNGYIQNVQLTDNDGKIWNIAEGKNIKQIHRNGTTLRIRAANYFETYSWKTITSISFEVEKLYYFKTSNSAPNVVYSSYYPVKFKSYNGTFDASAGTYNEMDSLDDVDRIDDKLIKIITIPYFPSSYEYDQENNTISTDSTWTYSTSLYKGFRLNNLNTQFNSVVESSIDNPLDVFNLGNFTPYDMLRDDYYESKLFHSDYYQPKFVYDSFGFVFALEKIDEERFTPSYTFTFEFIMTSTINSKFMFKFPEYVLKYSTEDYDNILPVARNNEAPIYNSAYITYLRTAYRYDLKQYDWRTFNRVHSLITGTIGNVLMGGSGVAGGGGFAGAFFNSAFAQINNTLAISSASQTDQISMEAKKELLQHQANSVRGSDDLDLLENYSGNRAKLVLYEVSPRMKKLIADLFYYFGYNTDEMKIPSLTSRLWFNYLQCNLEVNGIGYNIPDELLNNLKERYANGITFFHKVNGNWDLNQTKENWEVSAL